jgi:hypothetical protein
MVAVSELVFGLDAELVRLGYKASTMAWYRGCWRRLQRFFASRGVQEFSLDLAMAWVDQACGGFFDKEQAGTTPSRMIRIRPRLCTALDRHHHPHQRQAPGAAHNPALLIGFSAVADLVEHHAG